jgi:hypothetical protein
VGPQLITALSEGRGYGEAGDEGFWRGGNELLHVAEIPYR